jgi:hypothetical protein
MQAARNRALVSATAKKFKVIYIHLTRCLRVLRDAAASGGRAQRERALVRAIIYTLQHVLKANFNAKNSLK